VGLGKATVSALWAW